MASASVLQAIIRASRPKFRNAHDRVAFAVHSFMLAVGARLVAVGKSAEEASSESLTSVEEVSVDGWNELSDAYAFAYTDAEGKDPSVVKCVILGDQLLVHVLQLGRSSEPQLLELDVGKYTNASTDLVAGYSDLDGLVRKLQGSLQTPAASSSAGAQAGAQSAASSSGASLRQDPSSGSLREERDGNRPNPLQIGQGRKGDLPMGTGDLVPPGFPAPGLGPGPPGFGGMPGSRTGGMHMGPDDPLFAGRRGMSMGPGSSSLPPGSRYDPIGPPGMPGFHPDDFTPQGRGQRLGPEGVHPDMMQPGPSKGTDWDSMFG
ncbi:hypothetical protein WJX74_002789 [Apatococcus lobatus]|uniref:Proteasome inhibitor PI31 subunit n=1 Tax=Apatococcus lobatus TaxID=904363 RepID=A0AAW1S2J7_9CHLO